MIFTVSGATPAFAQQAPDQETERPDQEAAGQDAATAGQAPVTAGQNLVTAGQDQVTARPDQQGEAGDIVVTARRQQERLRDVPTAATVIDADAALARGGITDVQSLVAQAPAVRFFDTSSPVNSEVSIRGSGTSRGTNADPSVGLYRDGLYIGGGALGGRSFTRLDLFDLARAEVLRGPQGALYGRNAVGGAINIISAKPGFKFGGFIDLNYGFEVERKQLQAVVNAPLSETVAVRLGVDLIRQDEGFFYNPDNDVYFDRNNTTGLRGQVRFKSGRLDVTLLAERQVGQIPSVTFQVYILPNSRFPQGYIQPKYVYPWNFPPSAGQRLHATSLQATYDLEFATLNVAGSFRKRESFFQFDADALNDAELARLRAGGGALTTDPNATSRTDDLTKTFTTNIYLAGASTGPLRWLLGGEILSQNSDFSITTGRTPTPANRAIGFFSPSQVEYRSQAVYGSLGYSLLDNLDLTVDLRHTWDDKQFQSARFDRGTGLPAGGQQFIVDARQSPTNLSYTATAGWKVTRDALLYARVGSGYRAGAFNTNLGDPRAPKPVPPAYGNENSVSYEAGAKGNIVRNIYATLAGYKTIVTDFLAQDDNGCSATNLQCPVASTPFLTNAGKGEVTGVELEMDGRFAIGAGQLRLTGAISRQGGKIVSGPYQGLRIPQLPRTIASAGANYRVPFVGGSTLIANATYQALEGGVRDIASPIGIDTREVLDVRLAVQKDRWTLALYSTNVTDNEFQLFGSDTTRRLNQPRLVGVQLRTSLR
ncbi:MAG TPA: TonB-dependent receptor [Allosphingosinicella sp.]|nr:TonB-dependent receptor [Allosphingosinicella sp.]